MLEGPPKKKDVTDPKEKEQLGDKCVCPPELYFPKRKQTQKIVSGSTGIGGSSQNFEIQTQIQFLLDGWKKIMVQAGFWLSSTPSRTTCATQEQDKSMKGAFCHMDK